MVLSAKKISNYFFFVAKHLSEDEDKLIFNQLHLNLTFAH